MLLRGRRCGRIDVDAALAQLVHDQLGAGIAAFCELGGISRDALQRLAQLGRRLHLRLLAGAHLEERIVVANEHNALEYRPREDSETDHEERHERRSPRAIFCVFHHLAVSGRSAAAPVAGATFTVIPWLVSNSCSSLSWFLTDRSA